MESAFNPSGATHQLLATTTSKNPIEITSANDANQYRVFNAGSVTVFVAFRNLADLNKIDLSVPGIGSPKECLPIAPGAVEIITGPDEASAIAFTAAGSSNLFITPGRGL